MQILWISGDTNYLASFLHNEDLTIIGHQNMTPYGMLSDPLYNELQFRIYILIRLFSNQLLLWTGKFSLPYDPVHYTFIKKKTKHTAVCITVTLLILT